MLRRSIQLCTVAVICFLLASAFSSRAQEAKPETKQSDTPNEKPKPTLQTKVYDARSIIVGRWRFVTPPKLDMDLLLRLRSNSGSLFDDELNEEDDAPSDEESAAMLLDSLQRGIPNGNWREDGVSITIHNRLLVVVNTPEVQASIAALLRQYQEIQGKTVELQAKFVLIRTDALETFLAQNEGGSLTLSPQKLGEFKKMLSQNAAGNKILGLGRTICFNAQRVNLFTGNEQSVVSDVSPLIDIMMALDPELAALINATVLEARPFIGLDDKSILIDLQTGISLGSTSSSRAVRIMGGDNHPSPPKANPAVAGKPEVAEPNLSVPTVTSMIELLSQDSVRFNTSVKVPSGGAVILSGASDQFKHIANTQGSEIILLIEARVGR